LRNLRLVVCEVIKKLAGQKSGVEYQSQFNTILTRELLLLLMQGRLTSPAEVSGVD
jgi:hypothetical protein